MEGALGVGMRLAGGDLSEAFMRLAEPELHGAYRLTGFKLERHLRVMGAEPTPVPGSINRFMRQLPDGHPTSVSRSRRWGPARLPLPRPPAGGLAAIAAVALVVVVAAALFVPYGRNAGSPSPSVAPSPSASVVPTTSPSVTNPPPATPNASTYDFWWQPPLDYPPQDVTTPGAELGTSWTRLKITEISITDPGEGTANAFGNRSLSLWSGGWVITGMADTSSGHGYVWESGDGLTWHAAGAPGVQAVPSAIGLTVMSYDLSTAWVSADGLKWATGLGSSARRPGSLASS